MGKKKGLMLGDYKMLESMSKDLSKHQKNMRAIGKRIAKNEIRLDLKEGLIENLDIVSNHMKMAQMEVDAAKEKLKLI